MSANASLQRKLSYMIAVVVLFTLSMGFSHQIERTAKAANLSQSSLGEVDPVSGTAQLVFVGFKGVAVTFLWTDYIEKKRDERWFEIEPVLRSITLLQPNFATPWQHNAWNMAYNICAEWEAVADKYYWIRKGIDFMKEANRRMSDNTELQWYNGWMYYDRFGISDEKVFLRKMFREDPDKSYTQAASGVVDPNESAYDWYERGNQTIIRRKQEPKRLGTTIYMCYPAKAKTSYAEWQQKEGKFGEATRNAWRRAVEKWLDYGRGFGLGGIGRDVFIRRLEFSKQEYDQLRNEEKFWLDKYSDTVRYKWWRDRCRAESSEDLDRAHELFHKAEQARKSADYETAIAIYEQAFPLWRECMKKYPAVGEDTEYVEQSQDWEDYYLRLLTRLDKPVPKQRPFEGMYDAKPLENVAQGQDLMRAPESAPSGAGPTASPDAKAKKR